MAASKQGIGRSIPAGGTDGQVVVTDTAAPNDLAWGAAGGISPVASVTSDTGTTATNTSYAALTTATTVTAVVPSSGKVLVFNAIGASPGVGTTFYCDVALSGANTRSASDNTAVQFSSPAAGALASQGGTAFLLTGLTPGSTTFTQQVKVSGGTTAIRTGGARNLTVVPA